MRSLPFLGAGISFRQPWLREVLARPAPLACLEVIAEHYQDAPREKLEELRALRGVAPVLPHSLGLSFGAGVPLDPERLRAAAALAERVEAPWFTGHLAFCEAGGRGIGHLAPVPRTREAAAAAVRNVRQWQSAAGMPLLLENITYDVCLPGELTEPQLLAEIVERADCGLLLDLHNLHTNALNHGFDPLAFLEALPLERVAQVHLGGGHDEEGYRVDSHDSPTPPEVWELLEWLAPRAPLRAAIVERDSRLPPFAEMLAEVTRAAAILAGEPAACP